MVGANCSIFECSSSRKKSNVAKLKVPQGDNEWSSKWRKRVKSVVAKTKDRVIDKALREKKNNFICERHYSYSE